MFQIDTNRRDLFKDWFIWSIKYKDCDPAIWLTNYIFNRYEFNIEQRYWLVWLYGNTYNYPTAFLIWNEFPDFELASKERITSWNNENYSRLRYQTDTKYNKGHLSSMFDSYAKFIQQDQHTTFSNLLIDSPEENFHRLNREVIEKFYKFGRYTAWFYLQSLKHCCNLNIEPNTLFLNNHSGSRSHRNGLLLSLGLDDLYDKSLSAREYEWLEKEAYEIMKEVRESVNSSDVDLFSMETCLCSYKKIFREKNSRYLGYYLDRQSEEIMNIENDGWKGIEWDVLWQARQETLDKRLNGRNKINKMKFGEYVKNCSLDRMNWVKEQKLVGLENFI